MGHVVSAEGEVRVPGVRELLRGHDLGRDAPEGQLPEVEVRQVLESETVRNPRAPGTPERTVVVARNRTVARFRAGVVRSSTTRS